MPRVTFDPVAYLLILTLGLLWLQERDQRKRDLETYRVALGAMHAAASAEPLHRSSLATTPCEQSVLWHEATMDFVHKALAARP